MRSYGEDNGTAPVGDLKLWRRILFSNANCKRPLTGAVLLSLLITGATLTLPTLMQRGIDDYILSPDIAEVLRLSGLTRLSFVYGLLALAVFAATFYQVIVLERLGQSIMHGMRSHLFSHLLTLDLPFFDKHPTGRLVTRLTNDIQNMHEMFTSVVVTIFNDLLRLAGILVVLFFINMRLALIMSVFAPLALLTTLVFARLARKRFRDIRTQLARLNSFLSEVVSGVSIVQIFGGEEAVRKRHEQLTEGYLRKNLAQIRLFGFFTPLTDCMGAVAVALSLCDGGGEVVRKELTLGELVAFLTYMRLFFQPLRELSQKYSIVQSAMASAERIFELLDTQSRTVSPRNPVRPVSMAGNIVFHNVGFAYDDKNQGGHNINLNIKAGETLALAGASGSGKTTLVNLLLRFHDPQEGRITIDGIDIRDLHLRELRSRIGVVLQDIFILQDTLFANIVMNTGVSRKEAQAILTRARMESFIRKLPEGLDTSIGEGGRQLSTGEKQLLAFTRILCRNPAILVLDEATASIDTESERILEEAVEESFKGGTSLVIAHRLSTIRSADRIVVMEKGRIIEEGSHEELMAAAGRYAELIAVDSGVGTGSAAAGGST